MKFKQAWLGNFVLIFTLGSIMTGCSGNSSKEGGNQSANEQTEQTTDDGREIVGNVYVSGLPVVKDKYEFTLFMPGADGMDEIDSYNKLEEITNVDVKWDVPSWAEVGEKKNLMFASGDYPDVLAGWLLSDDEIMKYGPKGVLVPLEELIEKYTVNIKKMLEESPEVRKAITTPDGHIYTIPLVQKQANTKSVMHINKQWLDKLGLQAPKTTDELYTVLKAFKEKDPNGNGKQDELPLSFMYNGTNNSQFGLFGSFGRVDSYDHLVVENGKVLFTAAHNEWKDAVVYLNKLWKEGLIDQEVFTHDWAQWEAKGMTPLYGVTLDWDGYESLGKEHFKEYEMLLPLVGPSGQQPIWPDPDPSIFRSQFAITSAAKEPAAILRWLDQMFPAVTAEGLNETLYGPKGEGWTTSDDGKFKALVVPTPEGEKPKWTKIGGFPNYWPMMEKTEGVYMGADNVERENYKIIDLEKAYAPYVNKEPFPPIWLTPEQQSEVSSIKADILKATDENMARWVTGEGDINAEWDKFQKSLEKMGLAKLLEIYQAAVDSYNNQ
ncbi:extracellular solute-binding protein [Paenibacillus montanisoli]|uniref:ABC transporter substrate-binding protein n=1 Tax=Paenibacillus montanisoli TaxID=2081970 RepID=A0A328U344_9BACL|nr:extracellular solute-binding protein [Paenibacillus montanisoli]RAP77218.1 hypothetical protein DL346_01580 [Paenibacillus montanisoli]